MKYIIVTCVIILCFSLDQVRAQRSNESRIIQVPDDWDEECPFFNAKELEPLVEEYLQTHGDVCDQLNLCPELPTWAVNRDYNWKEIDQVKAEYLNRIPRFSAQEPLHMFVKFYMENISSVILSDMTFRIDYYVQIQWYIPKKSCDFYFEKLIEKNLKLDPNVTEIDINSRFFRLLWLPDVYIADSFQSIRQSEPVDTRSVQLNIANKDRTFNPHCAITYSSRNADTIFCRMDFSVYPFDEQVCPFRFRSFAYNSDKIRLHWEDVDWYHDLSLPGYRFTIKNNQSLLQPTIEGVYSILFAEFSITRQISSVLTGAYFPTFLIILIMISTFWLGSHVIGDRLNTGIIAVLAIYDQYNASLKQLPAIGYMTPIGYWMVISMLLVFAQLFQNAIYYQLLIKGKLKYRLNKNKVTEIDPNMDPIQLEMPSQPKPASPMTRSSSGKSTRKRKEFLSFLTKVQVDRTCHEYRAMRFNSFSRVAFCVVLILFISIYWPYVIKKGQIYNLNK